MDETFTVVEVAKLLRVSRQTVYIMIRNNKMPHFRVGNKVRDKRSDLEAMMNTTISTTPEVNPDQLEIEFQTQE